ncbi:MAG: DNA translocase FtsK 4TM domain-containing protein, partial [Salinibacterium sp.]|nr:DNA translocase FtsK 4TM domain-containing protein [Salinibacterium sp.]
MPRSKDRKESVRADHAPIGLWPRVIWLFAAAAWVFLAASLVSFDRADPPSHVIWPAHETAANWGGPFGASTAYWLLRLIGWSVALPMFAALATLWTAARGSEIRQPIFRALGVGLITAAAAGLFAVSSPLIPAPIAGLPGGSLGMVFAETLVVRFGVLGASIWLMLLAAVGLVVGFDRLVLAAPAWVLHKLTSGAGAVRKGAGTARAALPLERRGLIARWWLSILDRLREPLVQREHDLDEEPVATDARKAKVKAKRCSAKAEIEAAEAALAEAEYAEDDEEEEWEDEEDEELEDEYDDEESEEYEDEEVLDEDEEDDEDLPGAPQVLAEDQLREKMAKLPVRFAGANRKVASEEDLLSLQTQEQLEGYRFPTLDLLEDPEEDFSQSLETMVREQAEALESALQEYRLEGEVVGIESGPVITQYDVRLAPGTKVSKLQAISTDLARALKAVNVRIVGNQAGRDTVGVEVPNPKKEKVRLKELMADRARFEKMKLPMFLGKDASGDPLIADLTKMPHMLIAGTTGSGKSVCMNTIIMSFL